MDFSGCGIVCLLSNLCLGWVAANIAIAVINIFRNHILSKFMGMAVDLKKYGSHAVVTGATDGIGKAYAEQLARLGLHIVLVGRSSEKLKTVASGIEEKYKVGTTSVVVDFSHSVDEIRPILQKALDGLNIAICAESLPFLVNNVGVGYTYPERFAEVTDMLTFGPNMVNVNVTSAVLMCSIVLPALRDKKGGVIVNVGSASGLYPTPLLGLYAATKSFISSFTQSLSQEYRKDGIIVQTVMPFFVCTKMSGLKRPNFFAPDATSYAKGCLLTIGREDFTFGCLSHAIQGTVICMIRAVFPLGFLMSRSEAMLSGVRAKALRRLKKASDAEQADK